MRQSRPLERCPKPLQAIGQIGGHVKSGVIHPNGERTGKPMALVSAVPLEEGSDLMVLTFLDRTDPVETFDNQPGSGDNAVLIVPVSEVKLSAVNGVCLGDWRGCKVEYGPQVEEPEELDVDPTVLTLAESDSLVDVVDELGIDGSKVGGYPLWIAKPVDIDTAMGKPHRFHHRLTSDLVDFDADMGDGTVIYVFVAEDGSGGAVCWQRSGGGKERTYGHYTDSRRSALGGLFD
ncbi:MAG: hypothetical protein EA402_10290 [Planctomycetota bacterium]|nr:MAG: hypothetical protein EA402_10290 [Planctomycetota bacterium]